MKDWGWKYKMGEGELGVMLCGFGTGGIELGSDGAFHHASHLHNRFPEVQQDWTEPGSFFAVWARDSQGTYCKMLQADSNYQVAQISDLTYRGHFPFVDIEYCDPDLPVQVSLEAFSPIIPYDLKNSAIPAAIFTFTIENPSENAVEAAVAFSWTNDVGLTSTFKCHDNFNEPKSADDLVGIAMRTKRRDLAADDHYAFVALDDGTAKITRLVGWSGGGKGDEFWQPFSESGELPEKQAPGDKGKGPEAVWQTDGTYVLAGGGTTGSLAAKVELAPGESKQVRFLLAWYMPNHYDRGNMFRGHIYTNWFQDAWEIAEYVRNRMEYLHSKSLEWQGMIYDSSLPDWLKETLVNNLYILPRATWWTKDDTMMTYEALTCTAAWPPVLWFYNCHPMVQLFPELSVKLQEMCSRYQLESGELPQYCGQDSLDQPIYTNFRPQNSYSYAVAVYMDYLWIGGKELLEKTYESAKKAIQFTMTLDTDEDCLPNVNGAHDQAWDTWPMFGSAVYVCQFWLVALRAGIEMARVMGDKEFEKECQEWYDKALKNYEEQLWNGEYYVLYHDHKYGDYSSTCFLGQFFGQMMAYLLGFGDLFPRERIVKGLESVNRLNVADTPYGGTTGIKPDGRQDVTSAGNAQSHALTACEIYPYTGACLQVGLGEMGMEASRQISEFLAYKKKDPWHSLLLMYPETGELFYGSHYIDNLDVWCLLPSVAGMTVNVDQGMLSLKPNLDPLTVPIFSTIFYGMLSYRSEKKGDRVVAIELKLDNRQKDLVQIPRFVTRFPGKQVSSIECRSPVGKMTQIEKFSLAEDGELVFGETLTLVPGETAIIIKA